MHSTGSRFGPVCKLVPNLIKSNFLYAGVSSCAKSHLKLLLQKSKMIMVGKNNFIGYFFYNSFHWFWSSTNSVLKPLDFLFFVNGFRFFFSNTKSLLIKYNKNKQMNTELFSVTQLRMLGVSGAASTLAGRDWYKRDFIVSLWLKGSWFWPIWAY